MENSVERFAKLIVNADATNFIMAVAITCSGVDQDGAGIVEGNTRADFKRAIKGLRVCQKQFPQYASQYEDAIGHIRRVWLHRKPNKLRKGVRQHEAHS